MEEIKKLLDKAQKNIDLSEKLVSSNYCDFAITRLYYAMFYIAEAILLTKEISFSKHSAVISFFNKEFVKTGIFDKKYYEIISDLFVLRQESDYAYDFDIELEEVNDYIDTVKEFLEKARKYLKEEL